MMSTVTVTAAEVFPEGETDRSVASIAKVADIYQVVLIGTTTTYQKVVSYAEAVAVAQEWADNAATTDAKQIEFKDQIIADLQAKIVALEAELATKGK
jgi:hypothetical protein